MKKKRNILFFIDSLSGGGAERVCALLANSFATLPYNVTVVTIKNSLATDYQLAQDIDRVSLFANRKSDNIILALKNNLVQTLKLRKIIKQKKSDILISFMTQSNIVCSLACVKLNTINIASERIHPPLETISAVWSFLRKHLYWLPHVIVAQTDKTSVWLTENTTCKLVTVIPNPVNYPLQPTTQKPSKYTAQIPAKQKIILGVGRLVNQKQFDKLIAAFSTVALIHPDWILIIAGEGPNRHKLQQQIDSLSLSSRILLVGKQENMDYWYGRAEIFALSSLFEGYPNALLEAMCHGVASISYRCDTGPESIIQHQDNGILVPLNDEKLLATSMHELINDCALRNRIGHNAKNIAHTHSIDTITKQWELLIDRLDKKES